MSRAESLQLQTVGDLEAVAVAETFSLLSEVFGPYCFSVTGEAGEQQAIFKSESHYALFYIRLREFTAVAPGIYSGEDAPKSLSLLAAGEWLCQRYPVEAENAGLASASTELRSWLNELMHVRFWSGELWRHVELEASFGELLAAHAHFLKHTLFKLSQEIEKLQKYADRISYNLPPVEAVAAKEEYARHLAGMMEYYATRCAEMFGRYFFAFHRFVSARYRTNPTNELDQFEVPDTVSSDVFRYLYASAIHSFAGWQADRIREYVPETAPSLRKPYPQHWDEDPAR